MKAMPDQKVLALVDSWFDKWQEIEGSQTGQVALRDVIAVETQRVVKRSYNKGFNAALEIIANTCREELDRKETDDPCDPERRMGLRE